VKSQESAPLPTFGPILGHNRYQILSKGRQMG